MFSRKTVSSIIALLADDPDATAEEKVALMQVLEQGRTVRRGTNVRVVKFADAAGRLGVSVSTIRNLTHRGRLRPVLGFGSKRIGVSEESLVDFICQEQQKGEK